MLYSLMHRQMPVADVDIHPDTANILKTVRVYDPDRLPIGVQCGDGRPNLKSLNVWWSGRAIPASRSGLRDALENLHTTTSQLLMKCFGLSLTDQYWMNPSDAPLRWEDINFFDNPFSEDVGNALFGKMEDGAQVNLMSPDNTSDGWLKKKWVIADGKRLLVKAGSPPAYQEPLNELLATAVLRRLGIAHTAYTLAWEDGKPLSVCEDFITADTDLVSAWHISETLKRANHISKHQHFLDCCDALGIPGMRQGLDEMLVLDYLVANTDRHYNNFGAVRDARSLEWIGPAPIFDTGTAMWHNQFTSRIHPEEDVESKPFRAKHSEQIKLVSSFDWLDLRALDGIEDEYAEILAQSPFIDAERQDALCHALRSRIGQLQDIVMEQAPAQAPGWKQEQQM